MVDLQQLARAQSAWSLEDFVDVVSSLVVQFLPAASGDADDSITPRLVRYYVAEGLVDKPTRKGRYAFYGYRQVLQVLLVRRLLAEGYSLGAIAPLIQDKPNDQLEALLQGGVQLSVETANPALAFLQQLRQTTHSRSAAPVDVSASRPLPLSPPPLEPAETWQRLTVLPGLEIHFRQGFPWPQTLQEQRNLLEQVMQQLRVFLRSPNE